MISDKQMAAAADILFSAMLDSLPSENEYNHQFSPQFERKMQRLIRRAEHPVRYRILRSVASIALAIILGFATLLAVSSDVRATFFGWVKEQYESFTRYYYEGERSHAEEWDSYEITYIPDGFTEWERINKRNTKSVIYTNQDFSETISFVCSTDHHYLSVYILNNRGHISSTVINGKSAEILIPYDDNQNITVVWIEPSTNSFCLISACLELEEIIHIIESIK